MSWRGHAPYAHCYSAGAFGGVRAAIALRAMLGELGMSSIPSIFPVPKVQDAFREDGSPIDASARAEQLLGAAVDRVSTVSYITHGHKSLFLDPLTLTLTRSGRDLKEAIYDRSP